jgi:flagellar biosynthesis/type III secretory pathway chaperone
MNKENHLAFDALTNQGIDVLKKLNATLQNELTSLTSRDLDEIKLCSNQKNQILTEFSENTLQRIQILKASGFESDKESVSEFFSLCEDPSLKTLCVENWTILEETLQATLDANNVNEQVLKRNQKNIDTVLSILQGKRANNILYDAKGDKGDYAGQSRIGKA